VLVLVGGINALIEGKNLINEIVTNGAYLSLLFFSPIWLIPLTRFIYTKISCNYTEKYSFIDLFIGCILSGACGFIHFFL